MHLSRVDRGFFHCFTMMALLQAISLLVVCGLIECNDSTCNVTCTTDFISMLNCSNSDLAGTASCVIVADCRDEGNAVNASCSIKSPQSWCIIESEEHELIMAYDTICNITVTQMDHKGGMESASNRYSEEMFLYKSVKPKKPFNLRIEEFDEGFNLTWDVAYTEHDLYEKLHYRVRMRTKGAPDEKGQMYLLEQNQQSMVIMSESISPGRQYVADVQVAVHPRWFTSMWSAWSNSVEWTTQWTSGGIFELKSNAPGSEQYCFLLLVAVAIVVMVVLLYSVKLGGIKKLSLWQHIPSPHDYFKPLYHTYQGDFKKWVGPVLTFSNYDVLEKSATLQVLCVKQHSESSEEPDNNSNSHQDSRPFSLARQNSSKLLGSNSHGVTHSGGHISMDTVTVSDQEGIMADCSDKSHRQSLEDFLSSKEANQRLHEVTDGQPGAVGPDRRGGLQALDCDDWHLQEDDLENIEHVSLDSYSSNEQSDDGYPQMRLDLDTIDSGFLESDCSSPSAYDGNEQIETSCLDGVECSHSNYVKQWAAFSAVQVDTQSTGT